MAYSPSAIAPRAFDYAEAPAPARSRAVRRGLWQRIVDALVLSRQRQADREIARYLHDSGGKITDQAEREIERRFLSPM